MPEVTTALPLARRLLLASRPVSWINTAFPFAAAMLLTSGEIDARLVIGTLFFLVPYNLAMYGINDVFDYASDVANPRKGGVEGALLPPATHRATLGWAIGLALPFVAVLVAFGGPASWAVLAVSLFAVVAYSAPGLRWKEVPVLDSITSSTHFVSPAVYGLVLAGAEWTPALVALLAAFFCWGMASHAFGAVQDVLPDREGGIASIATALGARATVRLAMALWTAAGLLMLLTPWPAALGAVVALPYLVIAAPFWGVTDATSATANRGWRRFLWVNYVCGCIVTLLCIAWAMGWR
ncbi:prenyltransferase [Agrococcus sp. KRD186]|uniref:prenyltransferase n=1 Tax=Agrococcus sp. KRD186 TaxID=2729730 RepID=UPI0019CFD823|nr:prenyltransferase [Agrococcus sp. KRD186]